MASGFEVVSATTNIVTTFHKSAIILTMLKEKRTSQEKKAFMGRRPKFELEFKRAEGELESALHRGADEIRRDFTTYCDRFGKDFSVGDQSAQLRFNEIKEDAKGMYRILEFARDLDVDDFKKLRSMVESTRYQTQAAMAEFQLRLLQIQSAKAPPIQGHPAFQSNNLEPPHSVELPLRDSFLQIGGNSPRSEARSSFEGIPIELEAWPQPPNSSGDQDTDDSASRRSTFTSSINSSEDSDSRSRAGTSWGSYTNPMTPITPLSSNAFPAPLSIPMIRHPSEGLDERAPGRISPVIEETKSQIYTIEQQGQTQAHLTPPLPTRESPEPPLTESTDLESMSRGRSQSDLTRPQNHLRARSPFQFSNSPGGLSALGVVPLPPHTLHKRNASEADVKRRAPDTRSAIIAASATLSSVTSKVNVASESEQPKRSNDFHGFCKGAWKVNEKGTKGLSAERRPIGGGFKAYEMFWQCKDCRFQGPMPNPNGRERLVDTRVRYSKSGIQYRWMFLAKCHIQTKTPDTSYRCLICHYEGNGSDAFKGEEALMEHVSHAHASEMSIEVQRRTGAVQGREPRTGEEWDLYIPQREVHELPASTEINTPTTTTAELESALGISIAQLEAYRPRPLTSRSTTEEERADVAATLLLPDNVPSKAMELLGMNESEKMAQQQIRITESEIDRARKESEAYKQYRIDRAHGSFFI